jgi:hypothetical protein
MRRIVAVVLLFAMSVWPLPTSAQSGLAADAGVLVALQQLKSQLDSVINTVDQETAARIRQAEIALTTLISKLQDAMDHGYGLINNTRDQLMGNVATVMIQTQDMIQGTTGVLLIGVNDSLVNLARIVTALPGINIPTYVYAITPMRFATNASDSHVEIHGYFPDTSKDHPVVVHFDNGDSIRLASYVNNTLGFDLPSQLLTKQESFVNMTFDLPVKHLWGTYYTVEPVKARVYVEGGTPFSFSVIINIGNPNLWATVVAPSQMHERADSARTTNNQTFTAPELFSRLVNDDVQYDMSTAEFVAFNPVPVSPPRIVKTAFGNITIPSPATPILFQGDNPCASGCTSSTGSWSWNANQLSIALSAPDCGTHVIVPGGLQFPYQCGGGTHADFTSVPTFRVKRRGAIAPEIPSTSQPMKFVLARKRVSDAIPLPAGWTSVDINGRFKEGAEDSESHVRLTSGPKGLLSANDALIWKAEVSGETLLISTR